MYDGADSYGIFGIFGDFYSALYAKTKSVAASKLNLQR